MPVGIRRDSNGDITHLKFQNRSRVTPAIGIVVLDRVNCIEGISTEVLPNGKVKFQVLPDYQTRLCLENLVDV